MFVLKPAEYLESTVHYLWSPRPAVCSSSCNLSMALLPERVLAASCSKPLSMYVFRLSINSPSHLQPINNIQTKKQVNVHKCACKSIYTHTTYENVLLNKAEGVSMWKQQSRLYQYKAKIVEWHFLFISVILGDTWKSKENIDLGTEYKFWLTQTSPDGQSYSAIQTSCF